MVLPIFPEGGLTSSVVTTVWIGAFVLCFFNLRFGWVLSGLVVPGYLVPLLILRPVSVLVITLEAILTYLIVVYFSDRLNKGRYSELFGRDRFFGLVLASIAVRLTFDGWLLPILADWLAQNWEIQIDWQGNLKTFGLVLLSLMANQFWKPGLARGLVMLIVTTAITAVIVRYGLMEFTNYRLSNVTYAYESLATSILSSPKAYIILVMTAFVASRMNVRYGWDFSGILIPALMALQWYEPAKILTSFVEAGIIYLVAVFLLKLPFLANATIEGSRKLLLFFNISFAYKMVLGHVVAYFAWDVQTSDFFGLGYLLSTLLAIKAFDKKIFPRVMRNAVEVSLVGAVLGNIVGFLIGSAAPWIAGKAAAGPLYAPQPDYGLGRQLGAAVGDSYMRTLGNEARPTTAVEARELRAAIELLDDGAKPAFVSAALADSGFRLTRDAGGIIIIARPEGLGRDLLLYNGASRQNISIILPRPSDRPGLAMAALSLFRQQDARWMLITAPQPVGTSDRYGMLQTFRSASTSQEIVVSGRNEPGPPRVELAGDTATAVDWDALGAVLPDLEMRFASQPLGNAESAGNRANVLLGPAAIATMTRATGAADPANIGACTLPRKAASATAEHDIAELAFLRFEVIEPLIRTLASGAGEITSTQAAARLAGYRLERCQLGTRIFWRLGAANQNLGTYFFAADGAGFDKIIETYSSSDAAPQRAAIAITESWRAGIFAVAPHRNAFTDSQQTPFGVFSQAAVRENGTEPALIIQVRRALGPHIAPKQAELVIAPNWLDVAGVGESELLEMGRAAGFKVVVLDRSESSVGFEIAPNLAFRYLDQIENKRGATFWLPRNNNVQGRK